MDTYSDIPDDVVKNQLEEPINDGKTASALLVVFAVTVLVKILIITAFGFCIICFGKKKSLWAILACYSFNIKFYFKLVT